MVLSGQSHSPQGMSAPDGGPAEGALGKPHRMVWGEYGFLALLAFALVCVWLSGRFAYREASLFQHAKANGQAVLQWATGASTAKAPADCIVEGAAAQNAPPVTWAQCRERLLGEQGPLADLHNPFGAQAPVLATACERGHHAGRGAVAIEKGTSSPPGFPPAVSYEPLDDGQIMARGLMLRVLVCDPSGYGVRIGEVKL